MTSKHPVCLVYDTDPLEVVCTTVACFRLVVVTGLGHLCLKEKASARIPQPAGGSVRRFPLAAHALVCALVTIGRVWVRA